MCLRSVNGVWVIRYIIQAVRCSQCGCEILKSKLRKARDKSAEEIKMQFDFISLENEAD